MKPSERIFKIFSELRQKKGGNKNSDKADAIISFLDEQFKEKEDYVGECPLRVHPYGKEDEIPFCREGRCLHILLPGEKICPCHNPASQSEINNKIWRQGKLKCECKEYHHNKCPNFMENSENSAPQLEKEEEKIPILISSEGKVGIGIKAEKIPPDKQDSWEEFESFESFFAGLEMKDEKRAIELYEKYLMDFIRQTLESAIAKEREEAAAKEGINIGMFRQWVNEERITDPKKMITNEDILKFIDKTEF